MPELFLTLFGGVSIHNCGNPLGPATAQPKRLALLALLAHAGHQGLSRDRALALLWPESDEARARNALNQTLFALRRDLGRAEAIEGSSLLRLAPAIIESDLQRFEDALGRGDLEAAVSSYGGPFLDGFYVREAPEFERWVETERAALGARYRDALDQHARRARERGELVEERRALERLIRAAPHEAEPALRLAGVLDREGNPAAALRVVDAYITRLRRDLELDPDAAMLALAARYRAAATRVTEPPEAAARTALPATAPRKRRWPIAAGVAALLLVPAAWLALRSPALDPRRVHILLPAPSRDTLAARLLQTVQDYLVLGIRETRRFSVSAAAGAGGQDAGAVARAARAAGAGIGLALDLQVLPDSLTARVTLADARRGTLSRLLRVSFARPDAGRGTEQLRQQVLGALAAASDPRLGPNAAAVSAPSSWESFQLFVAGRDLFLRTGSDAALAMLAQASARDSSFTLPLVWQMFAYQSRGWPFSADTLRKALLQRYATLPPLEAALFEMVAAELDGDCEGRWVAAQRVAAADPGHEWGYWVAQTAELTGYPGAAVRYLVAMPDSSSWRTFADGVRYWRLRFWSRIAARDFQGLLADLPAARATTPAVRRMAPVYQARALAALGRSAEVIALLHAVADGSTESELSANDIARLIMPFLNAAGRHETALAALALIDSAAARSDQAQRGFDPNSVDWRAPMAYWRRNWALARVLYDSAAPTIERAIGQGNWAVVAMGQSRRGALAARTGDSAAARRLEAWLAVAPDSSGLHPSGTSIFLMARARVEAALGNKDRAIELLDKAQRINWDGTAWTDPEFQSLRGNPVFERLTKPKG